MKTLEEIKNEVAIEIGYENYNEYIKELYKNADFYFVERINKLNNEIAKRYAKEAAIASLEKASENAKVNCNHEEIKKEFTDVDSGYLYFVDKHSITNEENIVLWKH